MAITGKQENRKVDNTVMPKCRGDGGTHLEGPHSTRLDPLPDFDPMTALALALLGLHAARGLDGRKY